MEPKRKINWGLITFIIVSSVIVIALFCFHIIIALIYCGMYVSGLLCAVKKSVDKQYLNKL